MKEEELQYALALQRAYGIGDVNAKKLIALCGSPKNVFKEAGSTLKKIKGIGAVKWKELRSTEHVKAAEIEMKHLQQNNVKPLYYQNSEYPALLKNCVDSPILLFQDGNFCTNNQKTISIVGTRKMTSYGREFCKKLIEELKEYKPLIVSGFAYGVDVCAHLEALKNNLTTVGVLAHGFGEIYPKAHKKYMAQMYERGGFLTEFWYEDAPFRENFLKRNRIIAGISEATLVVESADKGGALVTAEIANSYSKDVFAVPGRNTDRYSKGCNALIRDCKAALVTSADDIVQTLGWEKLEKTKTVQTKLFVDLTKEELQIVRHLEAQGKERLDSIAIVCNMPAFKVANLLFQLELKGFIRALPGKAFELL
jgi:DNA processing protein